MYAHGRDCTPSIKLDNKLVRFHLYNVLCTELSEKSNDRCFLCSKFTSL